MNPEPIAFAGPPTVGTWVIREGRVHWHFVESVIEDRAVTTCGRQLHKFTPRGRARLLQQTAPLPLAALRCANCGRRHD